MVDQAPILFVAVASRIVGLIASLVSGIIAIRFMLGYLRTRSLDIFVLYRFILAAIVLIVWLAR